MLFWNVFFVKTSIRYAHFSSVVDSSVDDQTVLVGREEFSCLASPSDAKAPLAALVADIGSLFALLRISIFNRSSLCHEILNS